MAAIPPLVIGLRALFLLLGCAMVATLIYTIYIDGLPFRTDLLTPYTLLILQLRIIIIITVISANGCDSLDGW